MTGEIVRFENITKEFPGVKALDRVSFEARPGEVLALLGENGAGKSTLLKILSGDYAQDSGSIFLGDESVSFDKPSDALACGISVIYQDRHIMSNLSVAENVFAGDLPSRFGFVNWRELSKRTNELLARLHIDGTATTRVGSLSPANQQMVEIAKDLNRNVRVIAFDEPTASLSESEIDVLFETIRELKDAGVTVLYVSHRMKEVFRICDRAVVLKDGKVSGEAVVSETTERELVSMMVGRDIHQVFPHVPAAVEDTTAIVLKARSLTSEHVSDVSFDLRRGEVLGIAGLVGAGRSELAHALFGADPVISGEIEIDGQVVDINSCASAIRHGIALCPEDRKDQALVLGRTVAENISQVILSRISSLGFLSFRTETNIAVDYVNRLDIRTPGVGKIVRELSGGNQQKVVLSRWLAADPKILILDEPTRGIDVGAKADIYEIVNGLKTAGVAIILISSELPEILGVCDRVLVMRGGTVAGELQRGEATEMRVMELAMFGASEMEEVHV